MVQNIERSNFFLITFCLWFCLLCTTPCLGAATGASLKESGRTLIRMETTQGPITLKLYDETPRHKANFLKVVSRGVLDSTLFHRVINRFMIQGGDPDSKHAADTATLGNGDLGYTVEAEFVKSLFHRRGVLAAAREGDDVNPRKASSACQFYIVTGRIFTEPQLRTLEERINHRLIVPILDSLVAVYGRRAGVWKSKSKPGDSLLLQKLRVVLLPLARHVVRMQGRLLTFTPEQVQAYTTVGGAPHLDGSYTVFGEVIEGMDVVDRIQRVSTDKNDRPLENIRILRVFRLSEKE